MHLAWALLPILSVQFGECRYSETRQATADAAGAALVVVSAGSGSLEVVGRPGLRQARIRATACASHPELLKEITLRATRTGSEVRINANDADLELRGREYARLDVVLEVPEGIATDIEDGSGSIDLAGIGSVTIDDGSGDVTGEDLRGDVDIEDGSGEIRLNGVAGNVTIDDGSGEIDVRNVDGRVEIDDSSGEITLYKVGRDVVISDSSGDIDVDVVGGAFTVRNDGSGGIDYRGVKGEVRVPRGKHRDGFLSRWLE